MAGGIGVKALPDTYLQQFNVSYEYPVHFTRNLFAPDNPLLVDTVDRLNERRRHRLQVFIDSGVADAWPGIAESVGRYVAEHPDRMLMEGTPQLVPGGERAKNSRAAAERVMESIADHHLCRQSYVLAIGGGSVLDIVGLAAALVHRGLRLIRIPTTVLSQDDSAVGVKNGIDAYGVKNYAGTFAPPFAVLIDFAFLRTLDARYWIGGIAEAFKVAIIKDGDFFEYLCSHANALRNRSEKAIEQVIRRSAVLHLDHIRGSDDPFEAGAARPLDFGHWSGHRLEVLSGYEIGHGQAVAIGIALDSFYAWRTDLISRVDFDAIITALRDTGLPVWSSLLERRDNRGQLEILRGIEDFREHLGGQLHVTLPCHIGNRVEISDMDHGIIVDGIEFLKQFQ